MSYVRDMEPDHFNTRNNLARTCLHHYICHATLQHMNNHSHQCREYSGSCLILPHGAQYKERLFPEILEPQNHQVPLTYSVTKEPFPMELVGDFRSTDPIFKGCYGDSFLYSNVDLGQLRWCGIHLPPYRSEIPAPLAPSYLQAKQPKTTKWSLLWAMTLNPAVESPKTKHSGSKDRHHCSSGHSSNTSTPKCPDTTSAKKPSSSKKPALNEQDKSPRCCGSHKCGCSPSPSAESVRHKWKKVCTEDTHALNSTLPISSSGFDGFHSPTGSHSDVTELQPSSITSTPLGLGTPQQWRSTSEESRHSLASLYTSPCFNFLGHPVAGPSNLTTSVPSLTGSHHVSSTWPTSMFTSGPSSPHLTIDQANSLFKLATECQALSVKLAKQFQVLLGIEAMHCNSIQGTAHETLTLRCSAREAAYSAILWDRVPEDEHEAMTCHLCLEADAARKEMHEVMYNHQLQYDRQLATFLTEAEMALNDMRDEVWATVHALAENEGIMFDGYHAASAQPAPTDSHRHFVLDTNTPHHHLWPGIFHLQKMAPRAGQCFTSPQGNQGIPHSVQSLR